MRLIFLVIFLLASQSCVSLNSVSLTQVPKERKSKVKVESDRWIILGLNFDNDYVDELNSDLKKECQGGKVQGILTKDETVNYFLYLVVKRQVSATGYCVKG